MWVLSWLYRNHEITKSRKLSVTQNHLTPKIECDPKSQNPKIPKISKSPKPQNPQNPKFPKVTKSDTKRSGTGPEGVTKDVTSKHNSYLHQYSGGLEKVFEIDVTNAKQLQFNVLEIHRKRILFRHRYLHTLILGWSLQGENTRTHILGSWLHQYAQNGILTQVCRYI